MHGELELVRWVRQRVTHDPARVMLGVGDDMAAVRVDGAAVLVTSDMLLDEVHFDTRVHAMPLIGRKAMACGLSDCAAMAVRPVCATISAALPAGLAVSSVQALLDGAIRAGQAFGCELVGGDTNSWPHPLAIDVTVLAVEHEGIRAVRRDGARPGDVICVTGLLGGSLRGKHLTFTPRVSEARHLAATLGDQLHAMMDISDGLSLDLFRMCEASGVGAVLDESLLARVVSPEAFAMSAADGVAPIEHAMSDGEDYELVLAVGPDAAQRWLGRAGDPTGQQPAPSGATTVGPVVLMPVGTIVSDAYTVRTLDGSLQPLTPRGYEHQFGA